MYVDVSFLFVYKFTDNCYRMETQLQLINIISYHPASIIRLLNNEFSYGGENVSSMPQPPTWTTGVSLFAWVIIFDVSGMEDSGTGSATPA